MKMKYSNLTVILSLLSTWEKELLDQHIRLSGVDKYPGGPREWVIDWFINGGYQNSFEAIHHGDYIHALYKLQDRIGI